MVRESREKFERLEKRQKADKFPREPKQPREPKMSPFEKESLKEQQKQNRIAERQLKENREEFSSNKRYAILGSSLTAIGIIVGIVLYVIYKLP